MRKYLSLFLLVAFALTLTAGLSSCFLTRRRGSPQFRQAPPPRINTTTHNRKAIKTRVKGRNYKNQYRSDYRGFRGGRDPYHYRGNRYKY